MQSYTCTENMKKIQKLMNHVPLYPLDDLGEVGGCCDDVEMIDSDVVARAEAAPLMLHTKVEDGLRYLHKVYAPWPKIN